MTYQPVVIRWAPEVQNIFYRGNKRNLIPGSRDKLEHFFNCAATLMTRHLQNLALDSAADYVDLLIQPPVNSSLCDVRQFVSNVTHKSMRRFFHLQVSNWATAQKAEAVTTAAKNSSVWLCSRQWHLSQRLLGHGLLNPTKVQIRYRPKTLTGLCPLTHWVFHRPNFLFDPLWLNF